MFFIYPLGHDQAVYSRPWFTWAIAALCLLIFLWMNGAAGSAERAHRVSTVNLLTRLQADPDARISSRFVKRLPPAEREALAALVADPGERAFVDPDLEEAVARVLETRRAQPVYRLGYVPSEKRASRAITSMFAHGGWFHLISNLILLLLVGGIIECFWRPAAYVALYVLSGIGGVIGHHLVDPGSAVPLVGASGAIAGLLGALLFGFARTRFTMGWLLWFVVFVRAGTFRMPAWFLVPLWAGLQIFDLLRGTADGVAYGAHVGGLVVGLGIAFLAQKMNWIARDAGYA